MLAQAEVASSGSWRSAITWKDSSIFQGRPGLGGGGQCDVPCLSQRAPGQARKKNPNLNFWVRIFSGGVGVFHVKGWGPKSSVCPSKPRESNFFWRDIPGFCRDIPEAPEKFEKKKLGSILVPYQDWKIKSREAIFKKSSFQYGMKFSIENGFFHSGPLSGRRKNRAWDWNFQSRMKFSNREWIFQARMKISCVGECFFFMRSSENEFFRSPGLWVCSLLHPYSNFLN